MNINDTILCKQDYGKLCYFEIGKMRFGDPRFTMFLPYIYNINKINLIYAGSGITPIYQIINNINLNKNIDNTQISLIYQNKTITDILLKKELEKINKINKNITIHFFISKPNDNDTMNIHREKNENNMISIDNGRITKDFCKKYLFPPTHSNSNSNKKVVSLLCGPYKMEQSVIKFLHSIGHHKKSIAVF